MLKIGFLHSYRNPPVTDITGKLKAHGISAEVIKCDIDYQDFSHNPYIIDLLAHKFQDCDYIVGVGWGAYLGYYVSILNGVDCLLISAPLYEGSLAHNRFGTVIPKEFNKAHIDVDMVFGATDTVTKPQEAFEWVEKDIVGQVTKSVNPKEGFAWSETSVFDVLCNYLFEKKYKKLDAKKSTSDKGTSASSDQGDSDSTSVSKQEAETPEVTNSDKQP